jgi:hypothetical protein
VISRRASSFSSPSGRTRRRRPRSDGQVPPIAPGVGDEQDHPRAQIGSPLLVHENGQKLLEPPLALRRDHSALQQDGAQLIDQGRPLADQTIPEPMKGLDVELVLALQFNKPHGRACRCFRDSLRVAIVILLRLEQSRGRAR